ncbi:hypothetical protein BJV74DRAFT_864166 [Russula compacta]|nr:hypothetical protein BJV74DRAFT_864166 [Russula compacta]
MANSFSQTYAPEIVEGTAHVAGYLLGRSLVDGIRSIFNTGGHVDKGDSYMDQSRDLLERHLQLLNLKQQNRILKNISSVKEDLEDPSGSVIKRHLAARKYRRWSKKTYKVIKRASDRARDDPSTLTDPFSDSHAMSMLTDVAVNDLDQVEMSTYQSEDTRDAAIVWNLHNRDASTQHLVATVSTEVFSGDRTDSEAPAALSLHKEDGSTPNLVVTSFNVSTYQRTDEAETRTISTVDQVEVFNPPEGH